MTLYLLNLADFALTLYALAIGLVELNPVVNWMFSVHMALFPLVKIVFAYFLCMIFARYARKSRAGKIRYAAVVGIYAATVAWNITNIFYFHMGGTPMMNALHLLWIVPLAVVFGFAICAVLSMASRADEEANRDH